MNTAQELPNERERSRETPPATPESEPTSQETGEKMRQDAGRATDDVMESIDDAWDMAETAGDPAAEQELTGLRGEATQAKEQLDTDIDALFADDEGWDDIPDTVRAGAEPTEEAELSPEEFEAGQEAARLAEDVLSMEEGYFDGLETLAVAAAENKNKRKEILRVLGERLGKKAAEILDSPELRKDLAGMKERLSGRWGAENGPPIATELTLVRLTALRETMGSNPEHFLAAIDIKQRLERDGKPANFGYIGVEALRIQEPTVDPETGELITSMEAGFNYDDGSYDSLVISREFKRTVEKDKDGVPQVKKTVEHSLFQLPSSMKANGIAADITRDSLMEYDKNDVDEVKLHANIDMGGYAWAAYGYGWDNKEMAEHFAKMPNNGEIEVQVGDETKKIKDLSAAEKAEALDELATEAVGRIIEEGRENLRKTLEEVGYADADELLDKMDAFAENPSTVTPQTLAEFGRGGPKFFRSTETGRWFTEDALTEAVQSGDVTAEDAADAKKKPFHAGKIALQNSNWFGKIDLKPDGEQGGMNRKALEKYLSKSSAKKP